ncbi:hypothetical protein MCBG_05974 [Micromonospora sp. M42]|nr:hypothetical protein MCBG_05974 [Micromonospora sp. M42]
MDILALDLGTSSVRGLVLDADAVPRPGALARRRVHLVTGDDGTGTLDGPAYLACLTECLDELAAGGHLRDVDLVATSAQWHSVLPLAADGTPSGPVLTWLDTRPEALAGAVGPADPADFHRRTGTWWHRCFWSVRLPGCGSTARGTHASPGWPSTCSARCSATCRCPCRWLPAPGCSNCAAWTGTRRRASWPAIDRSSCCGWPRTAGTAG